ncbi:Na+/H+ antiporter [Miltoncostaea oceani]|uniref:Na+/H+ antiporter n=1 Tax=Miltoncostaea oceani TaxID=2843216 RepID=UPI001C3D487A|nr:Na+/H+ antiporter [Miltoncostaea oceani]
MEPALLVLALVVTVGAVAGLCRRFGWSPPPVLVLVGILASFLPAVPEFELDPELVLIGFLPPLLYAAAIRTSFVDFRANTYAILLLSVGAVIVSTFAVGLVAWWIVPGVSLAAALALGAVVAPPDAVAATAIARKVGMPRRIVTILEGESLVNDATALVLLSVTITAITGSVGVGEIGWEFVRAVGGGIVIGVVVAQLLSFVRARIDDPVLDTLLSFTAPFVAFLPAEAIHSSGVLAVVITGLLLGHRAPVLQSAASRVSESVNWRTVQFMLENVVFLLIGLQLRTILQDVADSDLGPGRLAAICLTVLAAVVAVRFAYVFGSQAVHRFGGPRMRRRSWPTSSSTVVSWAGMRGVVTLAAAFLLPPETPQRDVLLLAAFTVVAGTLLVLSPTLPWLVRRLGLSGPDAAEDALQAAALADEASRAGLARLDRVLKATDPQEVVDELRERARRRPNMIWERLGRSNDVLEPPSAAYVRLRLEMLAAEREAIIARRDSGTIDDEVLREALAMVDREESLLDRLESAERRIGEAELVAPERTSGDCEHLRAAPRTARAATPGACEDCLREGTRWVHLRMCLACGHVGCCDSSVGRHAERHFHDVGHPVMRSIEPGEAWRWCYIDEHLG